MQRFTYLTMAAVLGLLLAMVSAAYAAPDTEFGFTPPSESELSQRVTAAERERYAAESRYVLVNDENGPRMARTASGSESDPDPFAEATDKFMNEDGYPARMASRALEAQKYEENAQAAKDAIDKIIKKEIEEQTGPEAQKKYADNAAAVAAIAAQHKANTPYPWVWVVLGLVVAAALFLAFMYIFMVRVFPVLLVFAIPLSAICLPFLILWAFWHFVL
ncbi:hypothetical protein [Silvimonas sp.]|uniref:hypothetical protein n=1 Tax=Silvimonas sp. TaxID=2650811 RepID=UPI002842EAF2|nr:hypothetical protein [Silvimonas sp.]MDR3429600.1 hypothetical protein [Silvimonas sp.]